MDKITQQRLYAFCPFLLAAILAGYTALSGLTLDHVADLSGALRMRDGQIPYRDFYLPYGPVAFVLLWPFTLLFSDLSIAHIAASITLNVLATGCMMRLARICVSENRLVICCGVLTAIWFLPPFGSYFHDHLAYLFLIIGFLYFLKDREVLAGAAFVLAFHSKQTVGIVGVFCLFIALLFSSRRKTLTPSALLAFLLSNLAFHILILSMIYYFSDFALYWETTFTNPAYYSLFKPDKDPLNFLTALLMPFGIHPFQMFKEHGMGRISFYPIVLFVYYSFIRMWKLEGVQRFAIVFFLFSTLFSASFLSRSFTHLILGLPLAIVVLLNASPIKTQNLIFAAVALIGLLQIRNQHPWAYSHLFPLTRPNYTFQKTTYQLGQFLSKQPEDFAILDNREIMIPFFANKAPVNLPVVFFDGVVVPWMKEKRMIWEDRILSTLLDKKPKWIVRKKSLYNDLKNMESFLALHCKQEKAYEYFILLNCKE